MLVERVTSIDDPRLAAYRNIANPAAIERDGLFVAEGRLVVSRLLALDRFLTRSILLTPTAFEALEPVLSSTAAPIYVVSQDVMDRVVGFNIHRGCLALAERPQPRGIESLPMRNLARVLVLEGVNNPDNVGGLFRSAAAFGADAVVLGPGCGDPLYRKAIRTSMAASLQLPWVAAGAWPGALETLGANGLRVIALTTAQDALPIGDISGDLGPIALVVGNEGAGLSTDALAASTARVRIPMASTVDSLNVAVAASIAMHHFFRSPARSEPARAAAPLSTHGPHDGRADQQE